MKYQMFVNKVIAPTICAIDDALQCVMEKRFTCSSEHKIFPISHIFRSHLRKPPHTTIVLPGVKRKNGVMLDLPFGVMPFEELFKNVFVDDSAAKEYKILYVVYSTHVVNYFAGQAGRFDLMNVLRNCEVSIFPGEVRIEQFP